MTGLSSERRGQRRPHLQGLPEGTAPPVTAPSAARTACPPPARHSRSRGSAGHATLLDTRLLRGGRWSRRGSPAGHIRGRGYPGLSGAGAGGGGSRVSRAARALLLVTAAHGDSPAPCARAHPGPALGMPPQPPQPPPAIGHGPWRMRAGSAACLGFSHTTFWERRCAPGRGSRRGSAPGPKSRPAQK